ncbi:MAG: hypothetical protein A2015_10095 [Spirochaetes bacterium GWF1_31_7]|nr:MAG: hypothetical protein A2Y30_10100 [Spirochaetes bacterium GWE1_32_154]OHD51606.1 MAG: hypothetical protein A2015_10095 [Spirochaetes bacterium GWF1_31_7]OHD52163.1 MAG: hypothetical protein A2Y29_16970 [Spirochaetes bacterium GWE2_31_10]HBD94210.1 hypothetical protein [Spirochaetia bacterium]HBI39318.1 hypothetical protein [Spirochaetia bacterium]
MSAVKEEARKILDNLSENDDWEDIMYSFYVRESIEHGLEDIQNGNLLTENQMDERLSKWLN